MYLRLFIRNDFHWLRIPSRRSCNQTSEGLYTGRLYAKDGYILDARQHQTRAVRARLCLASMDYACLLCTQHQQKQASLWCTDKQWIGPCNTWSNCLWLVRWSHYQSRGSLIQPWYCLPWSVYPRLNKQALAANMLLPICWFKLNGVQSVLIWSMLPLLS